MSFSPQNGKRFKKMTPRSKQMHNRKQTMFHGGKSLSTLSTQIAQGHDYDSGYDHSLMYGKKHSRKDKRKASKELKKKKIQEHQLHQVCPIIKFRSQYSY